MKVKASQCYSIVTTFSLLIQVLVEEIIANSANDSINNFQVIPLSVGANETEMIVEEREPNLNVTVMAQLVYSDEEPPGNDGNSHINNTFSAQNSTDFSSAKNSFIELSSFETTIPYSQLFVTSLEPNVNEGKVDKVVHKYNNQTNETIDSSGFGYSFEPKPNSNSSSKSDSNLERSAVDKRLMLLESNEAQVGIRGTTPQTQINDNIENSNKKSSKLGPNVGSDEESNELNKSINTYGLGIENIAFTAPTVLTGPPNSSIISMVSIDSQQNRDNTNRIKYSESVNNKESMIESSNTTDQSSHTPITDQSLMVTNTKSSGVFTTTGAPIDTILTTTFSLQSTDKSADSTQVAIPTDTGSSSPTMTSDIDQLWTGDNATHSMAIDTNSTTKSPNAHPLEPTVRTTANPKIQFNSSEHHIQDDDNESNQSYRRCLWQQLDDLKWNSTETGNLATHPCPTTYSGTAYRPCYSLGQWGEPDYSECRLEHLREIQSLILYHVHKHLVDGLYPLAEDLSRLVTSGRFPIRSPLDRLDAIDSLNAILRAKIKIRLEDEEKNLNLIQSLTTICDQVLTRTKVVFTIETEKNALITQKTAEALLGFRLLSENILRALIVICDDGSIRRIKPIVPDSQNIIMTLTHRTPFGSLLPLVTPSNYTTLINNTLIPKVIIHLEGVGISSVWVREVGSILDNSEYEVLSDIVLVSVVPAVSIEVDFEETPKVEVELQFRRTVGKDDVISCGRIRSSRDLWFRRGCETLGRNLSSIHCLCNELGIIAALIHKTSSFDDSDNNTGHNHSLLVHTFVLYISFITSLILLVISLLCQIKQRSRESCEASLILISLVSSLIVIQLTYILGAPFGPSNWSPSQQICRFVPLMFHFLHLISAFWMLCHTVFLYQRLWRPLSRCSSSSLPFSDSYPSQSPSSSRWSTVWSVIYKPFSHQWDCKHFLIFATLLPAFSVMISYYLNPEGYETKRYCWMSIEGGMLYSFIVPVSILILTNTVIMLLVLKRFFETKPLTHKIEIDKTQPALRAGVTLLPFFAVNWFLSVLALEDTITTAFQCIFGASNLVLSYLVFLFHCYQRYDLHDYIKGRIFGVNKSHQNSNLRLRKNTYPGRGLRVDIPRLCIGDDRDSVLSPIAPNSGSSIDCEPLLMPYSGCSLSSPQPNPNHLKC